MTATEGTATDEKNKLAFFSKHQRETHGTMKLLSKLCLDKYHISEKKSTFTIRLL